MNKSTSKAAPSNFQLNVLNLLDFCKGLAIALVFLFHYERGWFGWQGVHIFIVLSGFGLTYSCIKKGEEISWKQWYLKRAQRIFPTYWLVILWGFVTIVCIQVFTSHNILADLVKSMIMLVLQFSLLTSFSVQTMFAFPFNGPLWFIPLIASFYLAFPWIYSLVIKHSKTKSYLLILLGIVAVEYIYRAIAIYWLDGSPVGYENLLLPVGYTNTLLKNLLNLPIQPLNRVPDSFIMSFQLTAPFGLFPSRIAEFALGMVGAIALYNKNQKLYNIIFDYRTKVIGVFIWLLGYALVFVGLWGWIFADFFISLGLILIIVNLALICQQKLPFLFVKVSQLGSWSYYVFLTHAYFIYTLKNLDFKFIPNNHFLTYLLIKISIFGLIVVGTGTASWLLIQFDKSKFSNFCKNKY